MIFSKKSIFFLSLFIFISLTLIHAQASIQQIEDTSENIENQVNSLGETVDKASQPGTQTDYLKQEWHKILERSAFFRQLESVYSKFSPFTDPVIRLMVGLEPSVSFLFIITFFVWLFFIINLYNVLSMFSTFSNTTSGVLSFIMGSLISFFGITLIISQLILSFLKAVTSVEGRIIIYTLVIIIGIVLYYMSLTFKKWVRIIKNKKAKEKELLDRYMLRKERESATKFSKKISESFDNS